MILAICLRYIRSLVFFAAILTAPAFAQPETVTAERGTVIARSPAGRAIWRVVKADKEHATVRTIGAGLYEIGDGTIVNRRGRVVRSGASLAQLPAAAAQPAWDPLVPLGDEDADAEGPVMDGAGNAYVLVVDSAMSVIRSNGTSGSWQGPQLILADASGVFNPQITVDSIGNITVLYRAFGASTYDLRAIRYTASTGWQGPSVIYSSPFFFQQMIAATDSLNNVVVVFDRDNAGGGTGAWSIVYSYSQSIWGAGQQVSADGGSALLHSLARNPAGTRLMMAYLRFSLADAVFVHQYSPATQSWGVAEPLLASGLAGFSSAGVGSHLPLTIDDGGNGTIFVPFYIGIRIQSLYGYRYENGRWRIGQKLLDWGQTFFDLPNFGDAAVNSQGVVLGAITNRGPSNQQFSMFRFTPGQGWNHEIAAEFPSASYTRCRVAWLGAIGEAVGTYMFSELKSVVYTAGAWALAPEIPGNYGTFFHETVTAPSGEVLLVFGADGGPPPLGAPYATWLRP
ncbi:MAG: hypothetical protein ACKV2U_15170 [Bryobacteraceae bacterium]